MVFINLFYFIDTTFIVTLDKIDPRKWAEYANRRSMISDRRWTNPSSSRSLASLYEPADGEKQSKAQWAIGECLGYSPPALWALNVIVLGEL